MSYVIAKILTLDDEELGYVVAKEGTAKLEDSNIWLEGEGVEEHVAKLNDLILLKQHWPDARDPEVVALTNDPAFEPLVFAEQELYDEASGETAHINALENPAQPMERYNKACEIIARRRAGEAEDQYSNDLMDDLLEGKL